MLAMSLGEGCCRLHISGGKKALIDCPFAETKSSSADIGSRARLRRARPDPSLIRRVTYGAHVPKHVGGTLFVQATGTHVWPAAQPVVTGGSPEMVQRRPVEAGSQFPVFGLQTVPV